MNEGKRFENNVKKSVDANTYFLRLNDSSPAGYGDQKTMRFSLQSPYDIILFKNNKMYSVELKSTKAKSISFDGSSPMIKKHQLKELERALCYGINAGFLLNFRTSETTYYVKLEDLKTFISSTDKKSINVKEVKEIGIEIPTQKLKVNYRYDLSVFVK